MKPIFPGDKVSAKKPVLDDQLVQQFLNTHAGRQTVLSRGDRQVQVNARIPGAQADTVKPIFPGDKVLAPKDGPPLSEMGKDHGTPGVNGSVNNSTRVTSWYAESNFGRGQNQVNVQTNAAPAGTDKQVELPAADGRGSIAGPPNTAASQAQAVGSSSDALPLPPGEQVVHEVLRQLHIVRDRPGQVVQARLTLDPPHLGQITVKLSLNGGELTAHFLTGDPGVRDAIQAALPQLREFLAQQQLQLGQASVNLAHGDGHEAPSRDQAGGQRFYHPQADVAPGGDNVFHAREGPAIGLVNYLA
ncbi:MAG: flagellar hook-length control protein FliK [Peptococcaceae bacterium]|nr:flagellar hook-length control protein FliK [Peptococcaceae bacterium]